MSSNFNSGNLENWVDRLKRAFSDKAHLSSILSSSFIRPAVCQ
jgi:hypothetical protein